jgi:WD40 repeat protein
MRLPDRQRSRAVLVGISTYRSPRLDNLPAVDNNLKDLAALLTHPQQGSIAADNCHTLVNPAEPRVVFDTVRRHAREAQDTLVVYFTGHGLVGERNELFLSLGRTDPEAVAVTAFPYSLVCSILAESPAANRVVILDCCFSGRAIADMTNRTERILGQVAVEGTYVLTSTPANAVALAPVGATHTAFTGELIKLLRSGIPNGPELLTFADVYRHLLHSSSTKGLPEPKQRGTGTVDLLALSRNPWQPKKKAVQKAAAQKAAAVKPPAKAAAGKAAAGKGAAAKPSAATATAAAKPSAATAAKPSAATAAKPATAAKAVKVTPPPSAPLQRMPRLGFGLGGQLLVVAAGDRPIEVWDVAAGRLVYTLTGHTDGVERIALDGAGRIMASTGTDRTTRIWDLAARRMVSEHKDILVKGMALNPDGTLLATVGGGKSVRLWDAVNGKHIGALVGHTKSVNRVSFTPDGRHVVSTARDRSVRTWDIHSARTVSTVSDVDTPDRCAIHLPSGLVAAACPDHAIQLRELKGGRKIARLAGHTDAVHQLTFSRDGRLLASAGRDNTIRLWDIAARVPVTVYTEYAKSVFHMAFNPDGRFLATVGQDTVVRLRSFFADRVIRSLEDGVKTVPWFTFSPDGRRLAAATVERAVPRVRLWDMTSGGGPHLLSATTTLDDPSFMIGPIAPTRPVTTPQPRSLLDRVRGLVRGA